MREIVLNIKSGNTDLSEAFDLSKADVQGDPNELLMEAFEKIAGNIYLLVTAHHNGIFWTF